MRAGFLRWCLAKRPATRTAAGRATARPTAGRGLPAGLCVCDPWWTGADCRYLNFQRPRFDNQAGTCGDNFKSYYSWGGKAVKGNDGDYHLIASFMCRHASLSSWTTISSSAHFVSSEVDGEYSWFDGDCDAAGICKPIVIPWSHNTVLATNPAGTSPRYLVAHVGDGIVDPSYWAPCFNKSQVPAGHSASPSPYQPPAARLHDRVRGNPGDTCYYAAADDLAGPWERALNNTGVIINNVGRPRGAPTVTAADIDANELRRTVMM